MCFKVFKNTVLLFVLIIVSCGSKSNKETINSSYDLTKVKVDKSIRVGANQTQSYLHLLQDKRIGVVANQTSVIFKAVNTQNYTHLVDSLLSLDINVQKVFAPEHGFRGTADAGELIKDGVDVKTGTPIVSIYGKNKKPNASQLQGIDLMIFDIQDVGARFYTYISTLHYVMEACAENNIPVLVLDRPNPNGHYIDGPILDLKHKSFVGMHPIPIVHGMTIGEYAQMINGEGWLKDKITCDLTIITVKNYTHKTAYSLPINPSPNLPNDKSINLYPSLCLFEGTVVSVGRGTEKQFQVIGSPYYSNKNGYSFTPQSNVGSKYPKHQNRLCYGYELSNQEVLSGINLKWLITFYNDHKAFKNSQGYPYKEGFFSDFFTTLAGTTILEAQIKAGKSEKDIKASWKKGLEDFKAIRKPYLLYED